MVRSLLRALTSAALVLLIGAGGGSMAVVDAFAFHSPTARTEAFLAHFEASSGCHADVCGVRSTAHTPGITPDLFGGTLLRHAPSIRLIPPARVASPTAAVTQPHRSRAPPPSV